MLWERKSCAFGDCFYVVFREADPLNAKVERVVFNALGKYAALPPNFAVP